MDCYSCDADYYGLSRYPRSRSLGPQFSQFGVGHRPVLSARLVTMELQDRR
jgi:hypothetical protein